VELFDFSGKSRLVETARLSIQTDGKLYHISIVSKGAENLANDVYDETAEYGYDGKDLFVTSDRYSPLTRTRGALGGFAYPERFPFMDEVPPAPIQAAWLAYCSRDYFNTGTNQTGLKVTGDFSMVWPDFITNLPSFWTNSTLPQSITGWSRDWIALPRTNSLQPIQAIALKQYPNGFKAWQFTASNVVFLANTPVPRQVTLETFFPKPPDTATSGEETMLLRKATFSADVIDLVEGKLDPLPKVSVSDLPVLDWRFEDKAGNFIIASHASPKGWPTRGSGAFQQVAAEADKIASEHQAFIQEYKKNRPVVIPPE
jgi:hypothetical protein